MGLAIDEINGLIATAESPDGFDVPFYVDFERSMRQPPDRSSKIALNSILGDCGAYLELIAGVDFESARDLSENVQGGEAKLMVQLGMVGRLIESAPQPPARSTDGSPDPGM